MSNRGTTGGLKVTYAPGTRAKEVVRILLENTGKSRNNRPSDYNFVRNIAQFGNQTGFITGGQMSLLGAMYNRVIGKGRRRSWSRL